MILNYYSTLKLAKALSNNQGLSLNISRDVAVPCTDGRVINLPPCPVGKDDAETLHWTYAMFHEIRHNSKGEDLFNEKVSWNTLKGKIINIIEDFRIEYLEHDQYLGESDILKEGRYQFTKSQLGYLEPTDDLITNVFYAMFKWDCETRATYNEKLKHLDIELTGKSVEYFDIVNKYSSRLLSCKTAKDSISLAEDIIRDLDIKEPEEGLTEEQARAAEIVIQDDHSEKGEDIPGSSETLDGDYVLHERISTTFGVSKTALLSSIRKLPDIRLGSKVKRLLMSRSKTTQEYGKRRGRLATKNLYRVSSNNDKIFKQKLEHRSFKGIALSILVDCSGSMGESKLLCAFNAVLSLNDVVSSLRIPTEIIGFTELGGKTLVEYPIKNYKESVQTDTLQNRLACIHCKDNDDGENILRAYHRIVLRKEPRKIIIVLSDGDPSSHNNGTRRFTKKVVEAVENSQCEIYGIGIMTVAVKDYYTNYVVLSEANELEHVLLDLIKDKVLV